MKSGHRVLAGVATILSMVLAAPAASASPHPRSEEWWFSAWGIERHVWPVTKGSGVTVAVLDTGVNAALPELAGVVLKGTDTTGHKGDGRRDPDKEEGGHGTGMAALIAGQGGGTTGFLGVAPKAKILPVRVTAKLGDPNGLFEAYADGIRFSVDHGARVISISRGVVSAAMEGHCDVGVQEAIAYAVKHDVVVVASSGNNGAGANWAQLPASCAGVVAVGAVDADLRPWVNTQRQSYVTVAAPGVGGSIGNHGQYFPESSGTSLSAALVSGAVALIRSRNPHMSARTVVQRLIATARQIGPAKWNDRTGYGAIQITAAMNPQRYPVPANAPNPVYDAFAKWQKAQAAAVAPPPSTPSPAARRNAAGSAGKSGHALPMVLGGVGALVIAVLVAIGVVWRRRSRRAAVIPFQRPPDSARNA